MKQALSIFTDNSQSLFESSIIFLSKLGIHCSTETGGPIPVSCFFDNGMPQYLSEALENITNTYFIGVANNDSLSGSTTKDSLDDIAKLSQDRGKYDGMLIFACDAKHNVKISKLEVSSLTRAFNRIASENPVIFILRQDDYISLATCERIDNSNGTGDKLGKVRTLRNINCRKPHRGHIDILEMLREKSYTTFDELYNHWMEVFSNELLTKKFYSELSDWYAWAVKIVRFPNDIRTEKDDTIYNQESCIRLITRLIFVWFLKQKHLIPEEFFDEKYIHDNLISGFNPHDKDNILYKPSESKYYRLILQNLFFAMLNCPIVAEGKKTANNRRFRGDKQYGYVREGYNINTLMRYESEFMDGGADKFLKLANDIVPFLNGGLFSCLDNKKDGLYYDGFSERKESMAQLYIPDYLFFGEEVGNGIDLSQWYGDTKKKNVSARGLIDILKHYSFTIEENTPYDQEVSLDPELLGKVFENLLASYNPETQTSARKQTGSFYTPREIVQYMVDECLVAHLKRSCGAELESKYRQLLSFAPQDINLSNDQRKAIMHAIYNCRVLDPACGSGAFPMGVLQQMVHVLKRLDPSNEMWNKMMVDIATDETRNELQKIAYDNKDERTRIEENEKTRLEDIRNAFNQNINDPDYARKLYLIEHCIYGVDIQPIATQISKLRFFISLVVDQKPTKDSKTNFGIRPLPNLEAKFVTANTLIPLDRDQNLFTATDEYRYYESQLQEINHRIFSTKKNKEKEKLQELMMNTRMAMAQSMENMGAVGTAGYHQLIEWNMFDQNASASFFDLEWMFGIQDGFDVVIANPPFKIIPRTDPLKSKYDELYDVAQGGKRNLYHLFYEKGINCMKKGGVLSYISPDTYFSGNDTSALRKYLIDHVNILSIIHYTEKDKVFENVTQAVAVLVCTKEKIGSNFIIRDHHIINKIDVSDLNENNKYIFKAFNSVISKIKLKKETFNDICNGFKGDVNLGNKRDYFTTISTERTLPLVRGIQITKYAYNPGNEFCYKDALSRDHTSMERIVFQEVANMGLAHRVKGTLLKDVILGDSTNYIYSIDEDVDNYYLLALINSKVVNYYFKYFNQTNHVPIGEIKKIPFARANKDLQAQIKQMVNTMIKENKRGNYRYDIEKELDFIIYHLYNLEYKDVKVIDPDTSITEQDYNNATIE